MRGRTALVGIRACLNNPIPVIEDEIVIWLVLEHAHRVRDALPLEQARTGAHHAAEVRAINAVAQQLGVGCGETGGGGEEGEEAHGGRNASTRATHSLVGGGPRTGPAPPGETRVRQAPWPL